MLKTKIRKLAAAVAIAASLSVCTISAFAAGLSPEGTQLFIPRTCPSTPQQTTTLGFSEVTLFSFEATKLLDKDKNDVGYQRIRVKAYCKDAQWYPGGGFGQGKCTVLSGKYSSTLTFQLLKDTHCEVFPFRAGYGNATYEFYYFGNNPKLDAYATIYSEAH